MRACVNGHKDVVQLLLDHSDKVELNAKDVNGSTAFILACQQRFLFATPRWNGLKDVVKLLVENSKAKSIDILTGQEELSNEIRAFIEKHQLSK